MIRFIILLCFVFSSSLTWAQAIKDSYIIDLKKNRSEVFLKSINDLFQNRSVIESRVLSTTLDIILIKTSTEHPFDFENRLRTSAHIESWGYDYHIKKRSVPNDQYFDMQWGLDLIGVKDAWEVTTGGEDVFGNQIVIAVLDDGFDLSHVELDGVIRKNEAEIPDDGIDNDNNGYVDDYEGWNTKLESDNHPMPDNHGIAVAGIIGAKTDNNEGIAGINWKVGILPISGIFTQAQVIAGYQYALSTRKLYNETNGAKGAFIVATNYSAGIDNAFGTDPQFKSWCDMYDAMADVGILSTGATANTNSNVDEVGDIPTTCPSPFLLSVTNVDVNDTKVTNAAYGPINIDLGAPGKGTLTLDLDNGYDQDFGGTSAATPHVAGAIGLLYSVPCEAIANLSKNNPRLAVEAIRDAILAGVDPNPTLSDITATGGRLNIFGAINKLADICSELELPSKKGELEVVKIKREITGILNIEYLTPDETPYNLLITDRMGRTIRHLEFVPPTLGQKVLEVRQIELISGIYFITIYNNDTISTQKLFVE